MISARQVGEIYLFNIPFRPDKLYMAVGGPYPTIYICLDPVMWIFIELKDKQLAALLMEKLMQYIQERQ